MTDAQLKAPILMLGNVRSGTTMMHDLFNAHPEVVSWFEPRTLWTYADPTRKHDRFDASDATDRVIRYIRKRFLGYQLKHGNRRVMEKTPSNMMRIPYMRRIFPESKLLYIVREPLANLSSTELRWRRALNRRRAWERIVETPKSQLHYYVLRYGLDQVRVKLLGLRPSYYGVRYPDFANDLARLDPMELISQQWVACARQADEDLAELDPDSYLKIRYEDLVASPLEQFERVLAFFDLEMVGEVETLLRDWVDPGRQQKWRRLDDEVLAHCLPILAEQMRREGYEIPEELQELVTA